MHKLNVVLSIVLGMAIVFVLIGGFELNSTRNSTQEKVYARETETMKKIKEHQMLQLEILQINARINQFSAPRSAVPITPRPVVPVTPAK